MVDFAAIREALNSNDPTESLRQTIIALRNDGIEKQTIVSALEGYRQHGDSSDEDTILEVLDFMNGFCSPHMRID